MSAPQAILFDLDGTLADTAPDLALALNLQREKHGLAALPDEVIRPYASHGTLGLLEVGFQISPGTPQFETMRLEYLALYDEVFCKKPRLFEGMDEILLLIESRSMKWGVVTNKPRRFTLPLMKALGLSERAACIVSADDCKRPKPYPDTLLLAAKQASVEATLCWYVGDAERDILAGRAAGMKTLMAGWGYLGEKDHPELWEADVMLKSIDELLFQIGQ